MRFYLADVNSPFDEKEIVRAFNITEARQLLEGVCEEVLLVEPLSDFQAGQLLTDQNIMDYARNHWRIYSQEIIGAKL